MFRDFSTQWKECFHTVENFSDPTRPIPFFKFWFDFPPRAL